MSVRPTLTLKPVAAGGKARTMTTISNTNEAVAAAIAEGVGFHWAWLHVGGSTQFVGHGWEDGGFRVNDEGVPTHDIRGNTVAKFTAEPIDPSNPQHVAQCEEWYNG